jgi:hypothetical protein
MIDASGLTIQTKIWYLEKHDVWITTGKDNVFREWAITQPSTQGNKDERNVLDQGKRLHFLGESRKRSANLIDEEYYHDGLLVCELKMHKDLITDVCEILNPLLVATSCMDKKLRLISLQERKVVGCFLGHERGLQ